MSDNMRWRYGDTNPVVAAVNAAEVIEIGDVLWQDTNNAKPAAEKAWVNSLSETQDALSAKFLGVAMQRHRAVDAAAQMRVATTGVFEFTAPPRHSLRAAPANSGVSSDPPRRRAIPWKTRRSSPSRTRLAPSGVCANRR